MNRLQSIRNSCKGQGVDQLLLTSPVSIDYLIHHRFSPGERFLGLLIFAHQAPILFLNRLFPYQPTNTEFDAMNLQVVEFSDGDDVSDLIVAHLLPSSLYVDNALLAQFLLPLQERGVVSKLGSFVVDGMRLIKDQQEQEAMRVASKLNDQIMGEVANFLTVGVLDTDVEAFIHHQHKLHGVKASFDPIVAFQQVASDPHGSANGQVRKQQDVVVIDMGLVKDNYCSDMTRTFVFDHPKLQAVYDIVKAANLAAIAMVKPGVRFCDVDEAARSVIRDAGYGEYFTHRTGHGIGIEVHEPMDVSGVNTAILEPGMCFSIEPGVYLPGIGGVRVEDLVLVTSTGVEVLNGYPK